MIVIIMYHTMYHMYHMYHTVVHIHHQFWWSNLSFLSYFHINPYFCHILLKKRDLFANGTPNERLLNDSTDDYCITLSLFGHFHPLTFYGLDQNTFLWARELYWMGHRTRSSEWLPFYFCMITLCTVIKGDRPPARPPGSRCPPVVSRLTGGNSMGGRAHPISTT